MFLNIKCMKWPRPETECESAEMCFGKIREITSCELILVGFSHLEPMCSTALLLSLHTDRYGRPCAVQCSVVQLPVVPPY